MGKQNTPSWFNTQGLPAVNKQWDLFEKHIEETKGQVEEIIKMQCAHCREVISISESTDMDMSGIYCSACWEGEFIPMDNIEDKFLYPEEVSGYVGLIWYNFEGQKKFLEVTIDLEKSTFGTKLAECFLTIESGDYKVQCEYSLQEEKKDLLEDGINFKITWIGEKKFLKKQYKKIETSSVLEEFLNTTFKEYVLRKTGLL